MNSTLIFLAGLTLTADPIPPVTLAPGGHRAPNLPHIAPALQSHGAVLVSAPDGVAAPLPSYRPPDAADLRYQEACPGSMIQPFLRLPHVRPVGPCVDRPGEARPPVKPLVWEFDQAAHFPLPRFCPDGSPLLLDGLLIYEGMRLTVDATTGTYDLAFTASVPDMPVTVRLQLVFTDRSKTHQEFRLTLPPVRLEPLRNGKADDPSANHFHIHHRGYSTVFLAEPACERPKVDQCWAVSRCGSARFGTAVAQEDPYR
jgi:hypothetical protein